MMNLLYKELRLAVHPSTYIFLTFGALLLIPHWPFFIAFGYLFIGFMNTFFNGKANQDIFFTACLPVRKSDTVLARVTSMAAFEIMQLIFAIPFAYLNTLINPTGNGAGMNPNIAFFGFVLIMYAVFNAILIPMFYRTAYKIGIPVLLASLAALLFAGAVEFAVHAVPLLATHVNAFGTGHLVSQLIVLAGGIVIFLLLNFLAYKRGAKNFEKVDL